MGESGFRMPRPEDIPVKGFMGVLLRFLSWPDQLAKRFSTEDVYQQPIDGHGVSYLAELFSEYDNLENKKPAPEAERFIEDLKLRANELETKTKELANECDLTKQRELKKQLEQNRITWDDLLRFESALIQLMPDARLRKRAWSIRDEYKQVLGDDAYTRYLERHPPDPDKEQDIAVVKADVEEMLAELHWAYTAEPVQESQRTRLLFTVLFGKLAVCAIAAICFLIWLFMRMRRTEVHFPTILIIMYMGAMGASLSSLLRLQKTTFEGNAIVNLWKLNLMGVSAILAPFVGALSAVLLTLLFAGHFLKTDLVPEVAINPACVSCDNCNTNASGTNAISANTIITNAIALTNVFVTTNPPLNLEMFLSNRLGTALKTDFTNLQVFTAAPKPADNRSKPHFFPYHICVLTGAEFAKLLVWCFIAGFSERLVPDIIDRLGEKAKEQK